MTQPVLPPQVAQLPWATQAVSLLTTGIGMLGTALTAFGISAGNASAIELAIQYLVFGGLTIAGLAAHTHLHVANQTNQTQVQVAANAPIATPIGNGNATMPIAQSQATTMIVRENTILAQ